jgi:hypothetical protein
MRILTDSSIPNPLNGILPNFTIFGAQFTLLWQKLIAGCGRSQSSSPSCFLSSA